MADADLGRQEGRGRSAGWAACPSGRAAARGYFTSTVPFMWVEPAHVLVAGRFDGGRDLADAARRHDPGQGTRQGRQRPCVVDLLVAPTRQPALGALAGALGAGAVDLLGA